MPHLPLTVMHYKALISPLFFKVFARSLAIAATTALITLLIAYPFSYAIAQSKHRQYLIILVLIPFWTSALVRTYALIALLKTQGLINSALLSLGFISTPLPLLYNNIAVVLGLSYNLLPFMILPLYYFFEGFDKRLHHAADDLGASPRAYFTFILLPLSKKAIMQGCIMVFLPALSLFYIPNILGGARSVLLGNYIENQFMLLNNWPQGAATSIGFSLVFIILFFAFMRRSKQ